jgi:hypothetical protein
MNADASTAGDVRPRTIARRQGAAPSVLMLIFVRAPIRPP